MNTFGQGPAADGPPRPAGGSLDDLRRANLSRVLRLVHGERSLSRAELTRITGLNRSTIASLVAELDAVGAVEIGEPADTKRRGRPSTVIFPSTRLVVLAVNPELDATTVALVALGGKVVRSVRFEHERAPLPTDVVSIVSAMIDAWGAGTPAHRIVGVAFALPALVRSSDGCVVLAPHLDWRDVPIARMTEEAVGIPTIAVNDADAGVIAENVFGAATGEHDVVYLNGGASGIGGGIVVGGVLLRGRDGFGGEIGHTLVRTDGEECGCGARGCLETEVRRDALLAALHISPAEIDELASLLAQRYGVDDTLTAVVDRQRRHLVIALRDIANVFNPAVIVLGGFLGAIGAAGRERIVHDLAEVPGLRPNLADMRVTASSLGQDNLLIGAAELAFSPLLDDPLGAASDTVAEAS